MKEKILASVVTAGLIAAASVFALAAPAQATPGTLTISDTTDWYPGQQVAVTLLDSNSDPICTNGMIGNEWALGLVVYDDNDNIVGGVFATEPAGSYSTGQTWNVNLVVGWLNADFDTSKPTYNMNVHVVGVCQDSPFSTSTNVSPDPVDATYTPITVAPNPTAQGSAVDVTVMDDSEVWCDDSSGNGHSMGIALYPNAGGSPIYIPAGLDAGSGVKGNGDFDWNGETTVSVTIPATVPVGLYQIFAGCIGAGPGYEQLGPGMTYDNFEVTAAELPDTGASQSTLVGIGITAASLVVLGAGVFLIRRRLATQR